MNKKNISLVIFSLIILIQSACTEQTTKNYKKVKLKQPIKIYKNKDWKPIKDLAFPTKIKVKDSLLYVLDTKSTHFINVFHAFSGKFILETGVKGKGPGEVLSPFGSLSIQNNYLWILDGSLKKCIGYDIDSLRNVNYKPTKSELFLKGLNSLYEIGWLNNNIIVGLDISEKTERLVFYDFQNQSEHYEGSLFSKSEQSTPTSIHKQAFLGTLKVKPDKSKIVVGNLYSDLIEIFDNSGKDIIKVKTEFDYLPKYQIVNNNGFATMGQGGDMRFGYLDMAADDNNIYALFSGETRFDNPTPFGKTIHVFDWSGNLLNIFELEGNAIYIEINDKSLYAVEYGTIPTVVKYDL